MRVINPTLAEIRSQWEKGLYLLAQKNENHRYLVILEDGRGNYHCHRYFRSGIKEDDDEWCASVDTITSKASIAFEWAFDPI